MFGAAATATFVKDTVFWCSICDGCKVHWDKLDTGRFFSQFGHTWSPKQGDEPGHVEDEYTQVIFAVCRSCLNGKGYKGEESR